MKPLATAVAFANSSETFAMMHLPAYPWGEHL